MIDLLLTKRSGDKFTFGNKEKYIPKNHSLERRIIRFFVDKSIEKAQTFFSEKKDAYSLFQGRSTQLLGEFYVDQFVEKLKRKTRFDSVNYIQAQGKIHKNGFCFNYEKCGKACIVSDEQSKKDYTRLSRIIDIRKDHKRHIIICDPKVNTNPFRRYYPNKKIEAAYRLLDLSDHTTLSYMLITTRDTFIKSLSTKSLRFWSNKNRRNNTFIKNHLYAHPSNLYMVLSANSYHIRQFGQELAKSIIDNKKE